MPSFTANRRTDASVTSDGDLTGFTTAATCGAPRERAIVPGRILRGGGPRTRFEDARGQRVTVT